MNGIFYFLLGLLVGYLLWKKFPKENPTRTELLTRHVESLIQLLAAGEQPTASRMMQLTSQSVSLGCNLTPLLTHYETISPDFQSMKPRQIYRFGEINIRYLYDYLPQRHQFLRGEIRIASMLYDFKAGDFTRALAMECVTLLKEQGLDQHKYLFICLPASTAYKHRKRYEFFSDFLSMKMGWEDGFGIITPIDHESQHQSGVRKQLYEENFQIQYKRLIGRRIILFDDVFTTGTTLLSLSGIIRRAGGYPEEALFLCRTMEVCRQTFYS